MKTITTVTEAAPIILEEIQKARHILLHLHPSPDPDSTGGALATYHVLTGMGKQVTLIKGDSHTPQAFSSFPGFDQIVKKNYFEIDLADFDLFIIQDTGGLEQISKFQPVTFPAHLKTIAIDHHSSNKGYADINWLDPKYSSVCEMLFDLFKTWGITFTESIATNLMAGLWSDTGGFQYRNVRPQTFAAASELLPFAPNYSKTIFTILNSRTENELRFGALALGSINKYFGGQVALSEVSNEMLVKAGISESEIPSPISSMLLSVVGWNIVVTLTEKHPGIVSMSFRTRDAQKYDVSKIATKLGGGGHTAASGAAVKKSLIEARADLLQAIAEVYPELGQA